MAVTNTRVRNLRHETNQCQHITNKQLLSARLRELDPATLPLMPSPTRKLTECSVAVPTTVWTEFLVDRINVHFNVLSSGKFLSTDRTGGN